MGAWITKRVGKSTGVSVGLGPLTAVLAAALLLLCTVVGWVVDHPVFLLYLLLASSFVAAVSYATVWFVRRRSRH